MTKGNAPKMTNRQAEGVRPVEQHAAKLETPVWLFAAAKAAKGWATGQETTEAEYRKAIANTGKERVG